MGLRFQCFLRPTQMHVPFGRILRDWMALGFEPDACRTALERRVAAGEVAGHLVDPEAITRGDVVGTEALLFGAPSLSKEWLWEIVGRDELLGFEIDADAAAAAAEVIRLVTSSRTRDEARERIAHVVKDPDMVALLAGAIREDAPSGRWPKPNGPGIYRREHASLFIQGKEGAIVTDPQGLSTGWTTALGHYPVDDGETRARVLITHGHEDHWDLASILRWTDADDPVVIPRIPAASLLCDDLGGWLDTVGQAHVSPPWHSRFEVGDIAVDVLPFHGEQPTRSLPLPGALRNWGNCYRFQLDGWSCAILVDSGVDATGSMVDVLRRSVAEKGPIDVVMSCCLEFPEAINLGLPMYAFTVPFSELRRRWPNRASMTNGPSGIAAACDAAGARFFLPYAHGFAGLGQDPVSVEGGRPESVAIQEVRRALHERGAKTEVIEWHPGDVLRWRDGRPSIAQR